MHRWNNTGRRVGVRWLRLTEIPTAAPDSSRDLRRSFIPCFLGFSPQESTAPAAVCSRRPVRCWRTCWSGRCRWVWCCFWCCCGRKRRMSSACTACSSTTCRDRPTVRHSLHLTTSHNAVLVWLENVCLLICCYSFFLLISERYSSESFQANVTTPELRSAQTSRLSDSLFIMKLRILNDLKIIKVP